MFTLICLFLCFFRYTLFTLLIEYACLKQSETSIFILNDLGLASMFNSKGILINNVIKNRHNQVCFIIAIQAMKGLPKNIRNNCSLFLNYNFFNPTEIDNLAQNLQRKSYLPLNL